VNRTHKDEDGDMGDVHDVNGKPPAESTVYTIEAAIADAIDQLTSCDRPCATCGIDYWIWTGTRLVRASPVQSERLLMREAQERAELRRLHDLQLAYRQQRWQSYRRLAQRLSVPLHSLLERWLT
jgi:hypothetical protein